MIKVKYNNQNIEIKGGSSVEDLVYKLGLQKQFIVGSKINGELKELKHILKDGENVSFIDLKMTDGQKIYKRSISFLFLKAFDNLKKKYKLNIKSEISHTLSKGQFIEFYNEKEELIDINNLFFVDEKGSKKFIDILNIEMVHIVGNNYEIKRHIFNMDKINKTFKEKEKINLYKNTKKDRFKIYEIDGYFNYLYGYMVPSTKYLSIFKLIEESHGITILVPSKKNPEKLEQHREQNKLKDIFVERKKWAKIMNVEFVNDLNEHKDLNDLIRTAEAFHENKIVKIADQICKDYHINEIDIKDFKRLVLIAGPSSSGKTSFSKRLETQLKVKGYNTKSISLDDYFVDREKTPLDEKGNYDFESIHALDLELFNKHLKDLLNGYEITLPVFNFKTGHREWGNSLKIDSKTILIVEGIHGLNPLLTSSIDESDKFKIYVSPLTQLSIDMDNRISTTDCRLVRRIIRDNVHRGHSPINTIKMWENVRKGEEKNIFPYQEEADIMFNSTLIYELGVMKKYIVPLLKEITKDDEGYIEANRLLKFLELFNDIKDETNIPPTSLLREFIGGSVIVH